MSAEIVDYFLIFWVVLAATVFLVGNLYDKQLKEKRRKLEVQEAKKRRAEQQGHWPAAAAASSAGLSSSSHGHNAAAAASNYSSQAHQYQPTQTTSPTSISNQFNDFADRYSHHHHHHHHHQQHQQQVSAAAAPQPQTAGGYYDRQTNLFDSPATNDECDDVDAIVGATIPTASGFNQDCVEWVNSILYLFYANSEKYGPIIGENVYRSLNEKLSNLISNSGEHSHLLVEFEGVNANSSTRPELTNVRTESESDKSVSATCKIYNRRISLNLAIRRLLGSRSGLESGSVSGAYGGGGGDDDDDDEQQVTRYELVLENLEGKLKSMAMLNERLIVIQFLEKPDTKILLRPLTIIRLAGSARREPLISEDALVQLILQTLTQVVVDLYFGNDADFPQYRNHSMSTYANYKSKLNNIIKGGASELKRSIQRHDLFGALSSSSDHAKERKVFVKIIKAKNINYNQSATCLLELDTPRQQALSSTKQGSEPFWDEHFLFNVTEKSQELTLELWDSLSPQAISAASSALAPDTPTSSLKRTTSSLTRGLSPARASDRDTRNKQDPIRWHKAELTAGAKFLGVARVPIEELRKNPIQKVNITLEPLVANGDPNNSVGGELQLELLFMEHSADPQVAGATATGSGNLTSGQPLHKSNSMSSLARYQQGDIVSIDRKLTPSGFVITTTTITKAPGHAKQHDKVKNYDQLLTATARNQSPAGSSINTEGHSLIDPTEGGSYYGGGVSAGSSPSGAGPVAAAAAAAADSASQRQPADDGAESQAGTSGRFSRSRSRSRSFIRAIKKRLSFSRTRSRSVGESASGAESPRVASGGGGGALDAPDYESRSRASSEISAPMGPGVRAKSMPASRDPSEVPTIVINKGGRLSDTAAALVGGAFSFAHPKSQLVIEVIEPGLREEDNESPRDHVRHYAVPDDAASQRKWRKRGTKLHVFNEHQFIACHLAGSSTCHLCGRVFSRRPGKQGYKCRNCDLLSHKECHVKVDHVCPYAQRDGLRLEYIDADPPAGLVDELATAAPHGAERQPPPLSGSMPGQEPYQQYQQARPPRRTRPSRNAKQTAAKSISMDVDDR